MAKTVAELSATVDVANERLAVTGQEVARLWAANGKMADQLQAAAAEVMSLREDAVRHREGLAQARKELDEARAKQENQERVNAESRQENALLRQRLDEHVKRVETRDVRVWGLIILLIGAVLSLASGFLLHTFRK